MYLPAHSGGQAMHPKRGILSFKGREIRSASFRSRPHFPCKIPLPSRVIPAERGSSGNSVGERLGWYDRKGALEGELILLLCLSASPRVFA